MVVSFLRRGGARGEEAGSALFKLERLTGRMAGGWGQEIFWLAWTVSYKGQWTWIVDGRRETSQTHTGQSSRRVDTALTARTPETPCHSNIPYMEPNLPDWDCDSGHLRPPANQRRPSGSSSRHRVRRGSGHAATCPSVAAVARHLLLNRDSNEMP